MHDFFQTTDFFLLTEISLIFLQQCYKEAEEIILQAVGLHVALDRLLLNMAIYYEESGDYVQAFTLFRRWYESCIELYGAKHPKSQRPVNTLREPMYRRIAQEKDIPIPELAV